MALLKKQFPDQSLKDLHSFVIENNNQEKAKPYKDYLEEEKTALNELCKFMMVAGGQKLNEGPKLKICLEYYLKKNLENKSITKLMEIFPELDNAYGESQWKINENGDIENIITMHFFAASPSNEIKQFNKNNEPIVFISDSKVGLKEMVKPSDTDEKRKKIPDLLTSETKYQLTYEKNKAKIMLISHTEKLHSPHLIHKDDHLINEPSKNFQKSFS